MHDIGGVDGLDLVAQPSRAASNGEPLGERAQHVEGCGAGAHHHAGVDGGGRDAAAHQNLADRHPASQVLAEILLAGVQATQINDPLHTAARSSFGKSLRNGTLGFGEVPVALRRIADQHPHRPALVQQALQHQTSDVSCGTSQHSRTIAHGDKNA